jgi:hypothetical protein
MFCYIDKYIFITPPNPLLSQEGAPGQLIFTYFCYVIQVLLFIYLLGKRMKRKKVNIKTKTKDAGQFKNIAITILDLVVAIKQDYFKIGDSKAATPEPQRTWPTFALQPTKTAEAPISRSDPGPDTPPRPSDIKTPYAFVKAVGMNSYGPVYYSPGVVVPTVIFSGNCVAPVPSGNYVFCIRVDTTDLDGFPTRTTPIKIKTLRPNASIDPTSTITVLAPPRDYPSMWNSLVPANAGRDYILGAISWAGEDIGTGPLYIVKDGVQVYSTFGSYLFPTISSDGTTASWCYKDNFLFGDRDLYAFTIATQTTVKVYDVGSNAECENGDFTRSGVRKGIAWLMKINSAEGMRDSKVYRSDRGSTGVWGAGIQVSDDAHRWNETPNWSPEPKYLVWASNLDAWTYTGYSVWGAFEGNPSQKVEITTWDPNQQDLWPDIDGDGIVVYGLGNESKNRYVPHVASIHKPGESRSIIDMQVISRDFSFAN